LLNYNSSATYW